MSIYTVCCHIVWTIYLADQWQSLRNQFETIIVFFCFFANLVTLVVQKLDGSALIHASLFPLNFEVK